MKPEPLRCSRWLRGKEPCRNRARYEGHMTEGNWQPVCGRHTSGFAYLALLTETAGEAG